jgi:micrococcal nuclease
MKAVLLGVVLLLIPVLAGFKAKVVGITDGDTIVVLASGNRQIKIRLEGIDCPEASQDFGAKAKQFTAAFCLNTEVRVEKTGTDRYGRTLAWVYAGDACLNKELLKAGLAWHFKKYNHDPELARLEETARTQKAGLWSQPSPVPPWEFRKK